MILWEVINSLKYYSFLQTIKVLSSSLYFFTFIPIGIVAILQCIKKNKFDKKTIFKAIIVASLIQSLLAIFARFYEPFQNILCKFLKNIINNDIIENLKSVRLYGLSLSLTYGMPVVQSLIGGLCFLYAEEYNKKYLIFVPLIWISGIINARVSMVIIAVEVFCFVLKKMYPLKKEIKGKTFLVVSCTFFVMLVFCLLLSFQILKMPRITDPIIELISLIKGNFSPKSEGYISYFVLNKNSLYLPPINGILFGSGVMNNTSDVGYIYYLWLGGLILLVSIFIWYLYIFNDWSKGFEKNSTEKLVVILFGITIVLVNIKGIAFLSMSEFNNLLFLEYFVDDYYRNRALMLGDNYA